MVDIQCEPFTSQTQHLKINTAVGAARFRPLPLHCFDPIGTRESVDFTCGHFYNLLATLSRPKCGAGRLFLLNHVTFNGGSGLREITATASPVVLAGGGNISPTPIPGESPPVVAFAIGITLPIRLQNLRRLFCLDSFDADYLDNGDKFSSPITCVSSHSWQTINVHKFSVPQSYPFVGQCLWITHIASRTNKLRLSNSASEERENWENSWKFTCWLVLLNHIFCSTIWSRKITRCWLCALFNFRHYCGAGRLKNQSIFIHFW